MAQTSGMHAFRLGDWRVEPSLNRLSGPAGDVTIEPRTMAVLAYLAAKPGEVVGADELIDAVWSGRPMGDNPVYKCMAKLRRVLEDDAAQPRYLETVSKKGYRLVAPVTPCEPLDPSVAWAEAGVAADALPGAAPGMAVAPRRLRVRRALVLLAAFAVVVALSIAAVSWLRPTSPPGRQWLVSGFPGSHSQASVSPDGHQLAFVNDHGGVPHVWTGTIDGEAPRQLTQGEHRDARPRWTADGRRILFQRGGDVWSVARAGGAPRRLIPNAHNVNVSADGSRLVFERGEQIWVADADGTSQRRLPGLPDVDLLLAHRAPALSPDGGTVAFFQSGRSPMGDLWLIDVDGGAPRQLTAAPSFGGAPAWTADGRAVIYSSQRGGSRTLWRVEVADGSATPLLTSSGDEDEPALAPDGRSIVYTASRDQWVLTVSDVAGAATRDVYASRHEINAPAFSPDGARIAYFGVTGDSAVALFTVATAGGVPVRATHEHGAIDIMPQWSRGGSHLYHYRSAPTPAFRLVAANGGAPTTLVPGWDWSAESGARVSPDGRTVVYTRVDRGRSVATMLRDLRSGGESPLSEVIDRPQWSPDGRWLAGTRAERRSWLPGEVVMCAVHASAPCTVVARGARLPQWSDDGTQLHYVRPVDDGFEVYATTLADRSERRLAVLAPQARTGEFYDVGPDGRIVWVRYERGRRELWKMELPR